VVRKGVGGTPIALILLQIERAAYHWRWGLP
jgi:hypothetical protein